MPLQIFSTRGAVFRRIYLHRIEGYRLYSEDDDLLASFIISLIFILWIFICIFIATYSVSHRRDGDDSLARTRAGMTRVSANSNTSIKNFEQAKQEVQKLRKQI